MANTARPPYSSAYRLQISQQVGSNFKSACIKATGRFVGGMATSRCQCCGEEVQTGHTWKAMVRMLGSSQVARRIIMKQLTAEPRMPPRYRKLQSTIHKHDQ